jgi:hypothetical protein
MRNTYRILVGKPEGKRPLRRRRQRWEDKIRMDLKRSRCEGVEWMHLTQDPDQRWAVMITIMDLRVP